MAKNTPKKPDLKIKSGNNKAPAIETKQPSHNAALQYIDKMVQEAPGTRQEHITAQQCVIQLGRAIQKMENPLVAQHELVRLTAEAKKQTAKIEKLQKQIKKLKGK